VFYEIGELRKKNGCQTNGEGRNGGGGGRERGEGNRKGGGERAVGSEQRGRRGREAAPIKGKVYHTES